MKRYNAAKAGVVGGLALAPGIGTAILAKAACPLCYPAIAGLLSSVGLGFLFDDTPLLLVASTFVGVSLFGLASNARTRRGYGPFWLGFVSAMVGGIGKLLEIEALFYLGAAGIVVASIWNLIPKRSCADCAGEGSVEITQAQKET